jgi:hypothetical protein
MRTPKASCCWAPRSPVPTHQRGRTGHHPRAHLCGVGCQPIERLVRPVDRRRVAMGTVQRIEALPTGEPTPAGILRHRSRARGEHCRSASVATGFARPYDPRASVIVRDRDLPTLRAGGHVRVTRYHPTEVILETDGAGSVVLSDAQYDGWVAEVDGQQTRSSRSISCFVGWLFRMVRTHVRFSSPLRGRARHRLKPHPAIRLCGIMVTRRQLTLS